MREIHIFIKNDTSNKESIWNFKKKIFIKLLQFAAKLAQLKNRTVL